MGRNPDASKCPFAACTLLQLVHVKACDVNPGTLFAFKRTIPKLSLRSPGHPARSHIWVSALLSWKLPSFTSGVCSTSNTHGFEQAESLVWKDLEVSSTSHVSHSFRGDFLPPHHYPFTSPPPPVHTLEQFFTCKVQKCLGSVSTPAQPHLGVFGAYTAVGEDGDTH